ncbi:MAG: hypothetical protein ACRDQB_03920 [Thermocrispum sp.]
MASISGVLPLPTPRTPGHTGHTGHTGMPPARVAVTLPDTPEQAYPQADDDTAEVDAVPILDLFGPEYEPEYEPDEVDRAEPTRIPPALAGPARRTKVTLTPAVRESDEVRVYVAPPLDGLSNFDLGRVPASVTPPRSWRKAAWFATVSSGGVAVALVLAGSYLVGQQPTTTAQVDGWSGFHGKPPAVHDEGIADTDPDSSTHAPGSSSSAQRITDVAGVHSSNTQGGTTTGGATSAPGSGSPGSTPNGDPTTSPQEPQKPPPDPADRETNRDAVYNFPPDAETMGDRSEIFLNQITENPERAHEQTGGELYAEGADAIAQRYADIAYFEVEHIYIDQKNRVTVNTVNVIYQDGTSETQQCTLRFEDGDRITQDCA